MPHVGKSVAALCLALAISSGPPPAKAAADPYNVDVILSTTGVAAFLGAEEKQALEILESYLNTTGSIQGRPLHFVFFDDTSNPAIAVQLANHVIADKVPVLLGPGFTATCKAVEALMTNGPLSYCFSPAGGGTPGSFVFSADFSTPDDYKTLVRYFRLRGAKRIALLTSTDATGQDGERGIVGASRLTENRDVTVVAIGAPLTTMLRAINDSGYAGPVITSHGNMTYGQMNQLTSMLPKGGPFFASPRFLSRDFMRPGPLLDA